MNQKDTPVSPLYYKILVTLMLALSIILGVWAAYSHLSARAYRTALQNTYCRAADSAADNLANLSDDLVKGMYTGSSPQLSQICARLWKESAAAKSSLSALPLESTLSATNKFLSQAGDYAMYLSRKTANGSPLTEEERSSFASLREYADRLSVQLDDLACSLQNGSLTIEQLQASDKDASAFAVHADGDDRLRQLEDSFTGYPTLIYDGPFSDHLLEKTPQMTRDKPAITPEQAKAIASRVTDRPLGGFCPTLLCAARRQKQLGCHHPSGRLSVLSGHSQARGADRPPFLPAGGGQSPAVFAGAGLLLDEGHLL